MLNKKDDPSKQPAADEGRKKDSQAKRSKGRSDGGSGNANGKAKGSKGKGGRGNGNGKGQAEGAKDGNRDQGKRKTSSYKHVNLERKRPHLSRDGAEGKRAAEGPKKRKGCLLYTSPSPRDRG